MDPGPNETLEKTDARYGQKLARIGGMHHLENDRIGTRGFGKTYSTLQLVDNGERRR